MVAHVLRLRIAVLLGALRGDRRHVVRMVLGLVGLVAATAPAATGLLTLGAADRTSAIVVTVLAGSAATLGFAVGPLVTGAVDPLEPRRFVPVGAAPTPLAGSLILAGMISIPTLVLAVMAVCLVLVWNEQGVPPVLAVLAAVLGVVSCVLLARVSMAVAALAIRERRSRELTGVFLVGILVVVVPVGVFLASLEWRGTVPVQLREAVEILAYTPVGAAWAMPAAALDGNDAMLWGSILVAVATLALLVVGWMLLVRRMLSTTERPLAVRERKSLGWFAVTPGTPGGAVAARSLVYWLSDRRYVVNIVIVPITAALTVVPLLIAGVPVQIVALVPVPIMALFLGWLPHNDVAYDSTAVWMHIASGMRGMSDRVGRLIPVVLIALPLLAIAIPVALAVHGRWALLPAMVGVCASLFLCGLGLSSVASVVAPYAVTRPGDSPFQQPQRSGSGGALSQGVVMLGALVLSGGSLWMGWLALTQDIRYSEAALWVGLATGVVVLVAGLAIGSAVFRRSGSRLMEFAEST